MKGAQPLTGRREAALLDLPSVQHMADVLQARCREPSWVRLAVTSLDRFRVLADVDLEALLQQAHHDVRVAENALQHFGQALSSYHDEQIAALALGPKLWLRLNGVPTAWRPLQERTTAATAPQDQAAYAPNTLALLGLIGSGLHLAELLRLRLGDVGALDKHGYLIHDLEADPLAVQFTPRRAKQDSYITFLTSNARAALLRDVAWRNAAGLPVDADAPLIVRRDGTPATTGTIAYARQRNQSLIKAGNNVNVTLCRATGDFFRSWGMPGARFPLNRQGAEDAKAPRT